MSNSLSLAPSTSPRTGRAPRTGAARLGLRNWLGAGGMAILAGALAGMVIAVLFQPLVAAAPAAGAVTITTDPPGLPLRVDGVARGVTPLATMLMAGPHVVEIGDGAPRRQHQLRVTAGAEAVLHVDRLAAERRP